jgi:methionyl-tRNA formyltransferase
MGTPDFAVASLASLHKAGHEIAAVITATDKPGGRGRKSLIACPVAEYARAHQLMVLQPEKLREPAFIDTLKNLKADLYVVVAFRMLPKVVWEIPALGTINLHGSLLPAYRGAAPIHWAILNGEKETGVTIFYIREDIDTGDIILKHHLPIYAHESTGELHDRMMGIGASALSQAVQFIENGQVKRYQQPEAAPSHAPKIYPENALLDFNWSTEKALRWIRGMNPYPAAWFMLDDKKVKIFSGKLYPEKTPASPGQLQLKSGHLILGFSDGWVVIQNLQMEGRRQMEIKDFLNGIGWKDGFTAQIDAPQ